MKLLVTGAGGFIGQAVARALVRQHTFTRVRLLDLAAPDVAADARFEAVAADLSDPSATAAALADIDAVLHLASVPGGTAEQNPALSRRVNLDGTLGMLEHLDARATATRFVYASSIAVFGEIRAPVDDLTVPKPSLIYGAHKLMVEVALADFHRRGRVSGLSVRLPGVVARARGNTGLRSAFMSDIFHASAAQEPFVMPVAHDATMWIMSVDRVADNLIHALLLPQTDGGSLTLPALRITAQELAVALYRDPRHVTYAPDADLQAKFGAFPPLSTPAAEALGFAHDGCLDTLVATVRRAL